MNRLGKVAAAVFNLALAAAYVLTWAGVRIPGLGSKDLARLILFEFVLLMFGLPLSALVRRMMENPGKPAERRLVLGFGGVIAAALLAVGLGYSLKYRAPWPLVAVALLLAGKLNIYLRPKHPREGVKVMGDMALRLAALFFLMLPCLVLPLPELSLSGSTRDFGRTHPSTFMAWGFLYFGLFGVFGHRLEPVVDAPVTKQTV